MIAVADRGEGERAVGAGEQAEGEKERERAETRHDNIDVAGMQVLALAIMRHDQSP